MTLKTPKTTATALMANLNSVVSTAGEMDLSTVQRGDVLECVRSGTSAFTVGQKYIVFRDGGKHMIASDNFTLIDANPKSGAKSGFQATGFNAFTS